MAFQHQAQSYCECCTRGIARAVRCCSSHITHLPHRLTPAWCRKHMEWPVTGIEHGLWIRWPMLAKWTEPLIVAAAFESRLKQSRQFRGIATPEARDFPLDS